MVFYHIYVLNSMSEGQVSKRADGRVASMLKCALEKDKASKIQETTTVVALQPALQRRIESRVQGAVANNWAVGAREAKRDPLEYMQLCRKYLAKLDTLGWNRSYHQRLFHDDFLKACTRSFWKLDCTFNPR